jgi:PAT family beta-lactamase induction signal transducer AmpG
MIGPYWIDRGYSSTEAGNVTTTIGMVCVILGVTAFLSFLMSVCDRENAATEYAVLSAIFALPRTFIASASGYLTESMGYASYFWLTAALALPALLLLPLLRARVSTASAAEG